MFSELCSEWNPLSLVPKSQSSPIPHARVPPGRPGPPCQVCPGVLPPSPPVMPKQPEVQYFWSCQELAQCPGGAPLAWGVCGQAAAPLLPGRGKKRREMSRWIYLEPGLPPTASEGASGRARSQAREREVGEGDPGTSKGWGAGEGAAGCPNTSHMSAFTLQQPLPSHQEQERIFWGPPAPQRVSFLSSPWHPGPCQLSLQLSERGVHQSLENELLWLQCN